MGEQRGFAPLLTVDLASVTVELNLCESGARFPCKWSSVLEIYNSLSAGHYNETVEHTLACQVVVSLKWYVVTEHSEFIILALL